jgi:hypothetical protein
LKTVVVEPIRVGEAVDLMRERREILQKWPWLRAVLLLVDVASLIKPPQGWPRPGKALRRFS